LDNSDTVLAQRFTQAIDSIHSKSLILLPDWQVRDLSVGNLLISLVGAGDLNARPPAPKGEASFPKAPSFTPEFYYLQQLGESAFRSTVTQVESTVRVLAQF
jgi:hypothetical protein